MTDQPNPPNHIVAIVGEAGVGKDKIAEHLTGKMSARTDKYADFIKTIVNEALCDPDNDIADQIRKAGYEIEPNNRMTVSELEEIKNDKNLKLEVSPGNYLSVRDILQLLGTEVIRDINPEFHVKSLALRMLNGRTGHKTLLVPDARFPNELKFIQQYNKATDKTLFLQNVAQVAPKDKLDQEGVLRKLYQIFGRGEFANLLYKRIFQQHLNMQNTYDKDRFLLKETYLNSDVGIEETLERNVSAGLLVIKPAGDREIERLDEKAAQHSSEDFAKELIATTPDAYINPYKEENTPEQNDLNNDSAMNHLVDVLEEAQKPREKTKERAQNQDYSPSMSME